LPISAPNWPAMRFNPRTRTGCDRCLAVLSRDHDVSTHAPARGATLAFPFWCSCQRVSTHAPARGATESCRRCLGVAGGFNPRTRTGCDAQPLSRSGRNTRFNPRTRTGCDVFRALSEKCESGFQPTHPHGVRQPRRTSTSTTLWVSTHAPARGATYWVFPARVPYAGFNPRTRTGCDIKFSGAVYDAIKFQPTHPHGVRHGTTRPI